MSATLKTIVTPGNRLFIHIHSFHLYITRHSSGYYVSNQDYAALSYGNGLTRLSFTADGEEHKPEQRPRVFTIGAVRLIEMADCIGWIQASVQGQHAQTSAYLASQLGYINPSRHSKRPSRSLIGPRIGLSSHGCTAKDHIWPRNGAKWTSPLCSIWRRSRCY